MTYFTIAIVGFALAAVLIAVAAIMFFTFDIRAIRDELTGKTAARSIAEIRSRAKTRKRTQSLAAKNLGWNEEISSAALNNARKPYAFEADNKVERVSEVLAGYKDTEGSTTILGREDGDMLKRALSDVLGDSVDRDDGSETSVLVSRGDESETTVLAVDAAESETTVLATSSEEAKSAKKHIKRKGVGVAGILGVTIALLMTFPTISWGSDADELVDEPEPQAEEAPELPEVEEPENTPETEEVLLPLYDATMEEVIEGKAVDAAKIRMKSLLFDFKETNITIPYGVDIEKWVQAYDLFTEDIGMIKHYFEGENIIKLKTEITHYPAQNSGMRVEFEWDNPDYACLEEAEKTLPNLSRVTFRLDKQRTCWPAYMTATKEVVHVGTGSNAQAWFRELDIKFDRNSTAQPKFQFLDVTGKSLQDSISETGELKDQKSMLTLGSESVFPTTVYVKIPKDQTVIYQGTHFELRKGEIIALPQIRLDSEAPIVTDVKWNVPDGISLGDIVYEQVLYSHSLSLTVSVEDVLGALATSESLSGLRLISITDGQNNLQQHSSDKKDSITFSFDVPKDSYREIKLADIKIHLEDLSGNTVAITLEEFYDALEGESEFDSVVVSDEPVQINVGYNGTPVEKYYNKDCELVVSIRDRHFEKLVRRNRHVAIISIQGDRMNKTYYPQDFTRNESGEYVLRVPCSDEGRYEVSGRYTSFFRKDSNSINEAFCIDQTAPYLENISFDGADEDAYNVVEVEDETGLWGILFSNSFQLTYSVSDEQYDDADKEVSVSGIKSIQLSFGDIEDEEEEFSEGTKRVDDRLFFTDQDGEYSFDDIEVTLADHAGNRDTVTLTDFFKMLEQEDEEVPDFSHIYINNEEPSLSVAFDNNDVYNDYYYHRNRIATVTIADKYFSYYQMKHGDTRILNVMVSDVYEGSLKASDFEEVDEGIFEAKYICSTQGYYDVQARYENLYHYEALVQEDEFCLDKDDPEFGAVRVSPTITQRWGWLFAAGEVSVTAEVSDDLSGIDTDASNLSFYINGNVYESDYRMVDNENGVISITFPADDRRIVLSRVSARATDMANNVGYIRNLQTHDEKNISTDIEGLFVDSADPILTVSYDNNDARNGNYYNAFRTATLTIVEASFDFVVDNDPNRTIATRTLNGSDLQVKARDFKNPSGDGVTWVAQIDCDSDGEYQISASFTDPSGKSAVPFSDDFIVDTMAPVIMVTFDNDDASSGMYYRAPRTATIMIYETNFAADLTSVGTTAADSLGSAAGGPGAGSWSEATQGTWQNSVYFRQELHYTMNVTCTDLAGNEAEIVEVPEFVIDVTPPEIKIDDVSDRTAYAEEIAPKVSFSDTNMESFMANVEITSLTNGEARYFAYDDVVSNTSRIVLYSDFDYDLEVDDVYRLSAEVEDLAGNTVSESLIFSVNRYGSNYVLSNMTQSILGRYLKESPEVVVTEINVSGLESSQAKISKNDSVVTLNEAQYVVDESGGDVSWHEYTYTFPSTLFAEDAFYRVLLTSNDRAGNLSENLMEGKNKDRTGALHISFAVDRTAPLASLGNIEGNSAYYAPTHRIDVFIDDNMAAEKGFLLVDGERVAQWDEEALGESGTFSYDLGASNDSRVITLEVADKAGNVTNTRVENVIVTNDLIRYVLNTPSIFYPVLAGVIVVVCAIGLVIGRFVHKRSKSKREAPAANMS